MGTRIKQVQIEGQQVGDLLQVSIKSDGLIREWTFNSRQTSVASTGNVSKVSLEGELLSYTETKIEE